MGVPDGWGWHGQLPYTLSAMARVGERIRVTGTVQGVGFRPWVYRLAHDLGITGRVRNDSTGVTIDAFGTAPLLDRFREALVASPPPAALIERIEWTSIAPEPVSDFVILASGESGSRRVSIPPDLATCAPCLAEVLDPRDRRFGYPFTNCTNCGPRFTIARDIPYDRAATTMAVFEMCEACRREYESPGDRRFHAEPNACPHCGPRVSLWSPGNGVLTGGEPVASAARALASGSIVAVKGLGGFHLACDATSSTVVSRLRARKGRDEKPFAVMVPDLAAADRLAWLTEEERRLLASVERPIVLVPRRHDAALAPEVAPGSPLVGVLLPYTPLHHLLLGQIARPLVMTSGNFSEEPIAYRNDEALARLGPIADLFVMHDRDIESPCDDSVARLIGDRAVLLRRSRGYVPRAIGLRRPIGRPVLACGALLKNTFCLASGDQAWLGPHIGDLDNLATLRFFEAAVARLERFVEVRPEVVAYDLHPDYPSTVYARSRTDVTAVGVQHHHAHVASLMAEHGLEGPLLGLAYDGTGYGTDGTAWGGELLLARYDGFERLATFRPLRLAGGDTAIRQVWRLALAALLDAFGGDVPVEDLPVFETVGAGRLAVVRQMIEGHVNAPLAHGVGRYFDAFGALALGRRESRFEGQVALELNNVADPQEPRAYPFDLSLDGCPWEVDLRPTIRAAVDDLRAERGAGIISARFHNTLVDASAAIVREAVSRRGRLPVGLTGGCFQNPLLAGRLAAALSASGLVVHLHGQVPPGDGGIALGQAAVAHAQTERAG